MQLEDTRPASRHATGFLYLTIALVGAICFPVRYWPASMETLDLLRLACAGIYVGMVAPAAWQISRYESVEHWEADILERDLDEWRAEIKARRERAAQTGQASSLQMTID